MTSSRETAPVPLPAMDEGSRRGAAAIALASLIVLAAILSAVERVAGR